MIAKRNLQQPIIPPSYNFVHVPKCYSDHGRKLIGSIVQEVTNREHFIENMAEKVLLCNEVMRRQQQSNRLKDTSKPLSLEYIADRMDIDDPIHGFYVRTTENSKGNDDPNFQKGMLQGFIMVTTFTNWQKTFRWDSMHDSAFAYDNDELGQQMANGVRKFDETGSFSEALQNTVRCGDPWNEGIVWPRIAEISLLGGLSCGKVLLNLVIERLEAMPATTERNYDYVALQATKNSVPFYEHMGFVRVGAITEDKMYLKRREEEIEEQEMESTENNGNTTSENEVVEEEVISSPTEIYTTIKNGENPASIAKKFDVDVWDIIFLNHFAFPDIKARTWFYKKTPLFIPSKEAKLEATTNARRVPKDKLELGMIKWYLAKENETPKSIGKKLKVSHSAIVKANANRLSGLMPSSRLKEGTKLQVSHFHIPDDKHIPYNHWTFPDDKNEQLDPSYMMVRKLIRRTKETLKLKPVEESLDQGIVNYVPIQRDTSFFYLNTVKDNKPERKIRSKKIIPKPQKPPSAFTFYSRDARSRLKGQLQRKTAEEAKSYLKASWNKLSASEKTTYENMSKKARQEYEDAMDILSKTDKPQEVSEKKELKRCTIPLFNEVIKLNEEGKKYLGPEFTYYYVLTYLPDLEWCHLCPLVQNGILENGRPKWNLVHESEGKEIDTSALFCCVTKSKGLHGCPDADEEEWDIFECKTVPIPPTATLPISNVEDIQNESLKRKHSSDLSSAPPMKRVENTKTEIFSLVNNFESGPQLLVSSQPQTNPVSLVQSHLSHNSIIKKPEDLERPPSNDILSRTYSSPYQTQPVFHSYETQSNFQKFHIHSSSPQFIPRSNVSEVNHASPTQLAQNKVNFSNTYVSSGVSQQSNIPSSHQSSTPQLHQRLPDQSTLIQMSQKSTVPQTHQTNLQQFQRPGMQKFYNQYSTKQFIQQPISHNNYPQQTMHQLNGHSTPQHSYLRTPSSALPALLPHPNGTVIIPQQNRTLYKPQVNVHEYKSHSYRPSPSQYPPGLYDNREGREINSTKSTNNANGIVRDRLMYPQILSATNAKLKDNVNK